MRFSTSLGAAGALALVLFAGLGCESHYYDDRGHDRHVYRERVHHHNDFGHSHRYHRDRDHQRHDRHYGHHRDRHHHGRW